MSLNYFILGSILSLLFVFASKAEIKLRKISLDDTEALCNDKSRAVYYDDGREELSNKSWIIFFESGGLCATKEDCNSRFKNENSTVFMTSDTLPQNITTTTTTQLHSTTLNYTTLHYITLHYTPLHYTPLH